MINDSRQDGRSDEQVANPGLIRPPRVYLAAILLGVGAHRVWPAHLAPRLIGLPLGASFVLAAIALYSGAIRSFAAAKTPVPGNQPATTIVRAGPYRFSRNPIYLAFSLLQLGLAFLLNSLTLVLTLLPAFALMELVVIPREERYLEWRFPAEYASYKAATRRWL